MRSRVFVIVLMLVALAIAGMVPVAAAETTTHITVSCDGTPTIGADIVVDGPGTRGTVVGFNGGEGKGRLFSGRDGGALASMLHDDGWRTVSVAWDESWWWSTQPDGFKALGCRPWEAARYVKRNVHTGGEFVVTGWSGGASATASLLTFKRGHRFVDRAVPFGGPIHTDFERSCLAGTPGYDIVYSVGKWQRAMDLPWGITSNGPCATRDTSFIPEWNANSLATSGRHNFRDTQVITVNGLVRDESLAKLWREKAINAGSDVTFVYDSSLPHGVHKTAFGRQVLRVAINGE